MWCHYDVIIIIISKFWNLPSFFKFFIRSERDFSGWNSFLKLMCKAIIQFILHKKVKSQFFMHFVGAFVIMTIDIWWGAISYHIAYMYLFLPDFKWIYLNYFCERKWKKNELAKQTKLIGISFVQIGKNISNFECWQNIAQYLWRRKD